MDFFGELRIWSHLLNKFLMENFIFCAVRQYISICHSPETQDIKEYFSYVRLVDEFLINSLYATETEERENSTKNEGAKDSPQRKTQSS